jgi:hypothetical protein
MIRSVARPTEAKAVHLVISKECWRGMAVEGVKGGERSRWYICDGIDNPLERSTCSDEVADDIASRGMVMESSAIPALHFIPQVHESRMSISIPFSR